MSIENKKILVVPYLSQYLDVEEKINALTGCGMTCIKMLLEYYKIKSPNLNEMINTGKLNGGYGKSGWIHDYFVHLLMGYGLESHREEKMDFIKGLHSIKEAIDNKCPTIISVQKKLFSYNNYHMIVITGYALSEDNSLAGFYYHDPESTNYDFGQNKYASISDLDIYWRKMAIFTKPINIL